MVIKVLKLDSLMKKAEEIPDLDVSPVMKDVGRMVQGKAKELAPVNKDPKAPTRGNLRNSIKSQVLKRKGKLGSPWAVARIFTAVEYAIYQEFGTYKMKAQPFLIPAVNQERLAINSKVGAFLREELAKFRAKGS